MQACSLFYAVFSSLILLIIFLKSRNLSHWLENHIDPWQGINNTMSTLLNSRGFFFNNNTFSIDHAWNSVIRLEFYGFGLTVHRKIWQTSHAALKSSTNFCWYFADEEVRICYMEANIFWNVPCFYCLEEMIEWQCGFRKATFSFCVQIAMLQWRHGILNNPAV